jgi:hypothetical protein
MTTTILARVRRVMRGHSDRALIVAVNEAGLEQKIEVPLEAVRDVDNSGEHVLMLTWSLHTLPPVLRPQAPATSPATDPPGEPRSSAPESSAPTSTPATTGAPRPSPSAIDQQFMALMSRGVSPQPPASTTPTPSLGADPAPRPAEQLAALLGIGRAPT